MSSRAGTGLQRLMLRTRGTPLRGVWALAYRVYARIGAAYLAREMPGASVYVRGGFAGSDLVPGLSDIDLVVVSSAEGPGAQGSRTARLPFGGRLFGDASTYRADVFGELETRSALTYGLDGEGDADAGLLGARATNEGVRALVRPTTLGRHHDWLHLRGPEVRGPVAGDDPAWRLAAGWLEIAHWWRFAFRACAEPDSVRATDIAVKAAAESARVWLWVARGRWPSGREAALVEAASELPEEADALSAALEFRRRLSPDGRSALEQLLPLTARMTARVAALIGEEAAAAGSREVALTSGGGNGDGLVLADWRSVAAPPRAEEHFVAVPGDPGDHAAVGRTAQAAADGPYRAVPGDGFLVMPAIEHAHTRMRSLMCPASDPGVFAVLTGRSTAAFPELRGWSAHDVAARGVLEHRAWLRAGPGSMEGSPGEMGGQALERLLTAARAARFAESGAAGEPELCVSVAAIAERLPPIGADARDAHRAMARDGRPPEPRLIAELREAVEALPAYAPASSAMRSITAGRAAITSRSH